MTPNKPHLVTGSPGGSRIITAVLQVIVNVIDRKLPIAEAVGAPRVHNQWWADEVLVERELSPDLVRAVKGPARGGGAAADLGQLDPGDAREPRRRRRQPHPRRAGGGVLGARGGRVAVGPARRTRSAPLLAGARHDDSEVVVRRYADQLNDIVSGLVG
jgi:hypothetical protein